MSLHGGGNLGPTHAGAFYLGCSSQDQTPAPSRERERKTESEAQGQKRKAPGATLKKEQKSNPGSVWRSGQRCGQVGGRG